MLIFKPYSKNGFVMSGFQLIYFLSLVFFVAPTYGQENSYVPKAGDIIFQHSLGRQGRALEKATHSNLTHCGIVFVDSNGVYVLEAVQPVQIVPFNEFIARGDKNNYCVKRLVNDTLLTPEKTKQLLTLGSKWLGKSYDIFFYWSDDEIYCSELVWKLYERTTQVQLCPLRPLNDYDLKHPEVRVIMQERYGNDIPWDELMVAPVDIFNSPLLQTVFSNM